MSRAILTVESNEDLASLTEVQAGGIVLSLGREAAGDWGGGYWALLIGDFSTEATNDPAGAIWRAVAGYATSQRIWKRTSPPDIWAFGGKGDGVEFSDGVIASGSNTFSSTSAMFSTARIGNRIVISGAGAAGNSLLSTITSINGPTSVEIAESASTTVSGALGSYGNDDALAIQRMYNLELPVTLPRRRPDGALASWMIFQHLDLTSTGGRVEAEIGTGHVTVRMAHLTGQGARIGARLQQFLRLHLRATAARAAQPFSLDNTAVELGRNEAEFTNCTVEVSVSLNPGCALAHYGAGAGAKYRVTGQSIKGHVILIQDGTLIGNDADRPGIISVEALRAIDAGGNAICAGQTGQTVYRLQVHDAEIGDCVWNPGPNSEGVLYDSDPESPTFGEVISLGSEWTEINDDGIPGLVNAHYILRCQDSHLYDGAVSDTLFDGTITRLGLPRIAKAAKATGVVVPAAATNVIIDGANRWMDVKVAVDVAANVPGVGIRLGYGNYNNPNGPAPIGVRAAANVTGWVQVVDPDYFTVPVDSESTKLIVAVAGRPARCVPGSNSLFYPEWAGSTTVASGVLTASRGLMLPSGQGSEADDVTNIVGPDGVALPDNCRGSILNIRDYPLTFQNNQGGAGEIFTVSGMPAVLHPGVATDYLAWNGAIQLLTNLPIPHADRLLVSTSLATDFDISATNTFETVISATATVKKSGLYRISGALSVLHRDTKTQSYQARLYMDSATPLADGNLQIRSTVPSVSDELSVLSITRDLEAGSHIFDLQVRQGLSPEAGAAYSRILTENANGRNTWFEIVRVC